jgi:aminopeptidase N
MQASAPTEVFRKDYKAPDFLIPAVSLHFALGVGTEHTIVKGALSCERVGSVGSDLVLDGEGLNMLSLSIDGVAVPESGYTITEETNASTTLTIAAAALPSATTFVVETTVEIFPEANHQGDGLYMSNSTFCTQCEPQGFRRITFNQDRPDILSVYTVTVEGDAATCPVLLSNGNRIEEGEAEGGRHFIKFLDPFPKPTYLFALVAGDLGCFQDTFVTMSGREVKLGKETHPFAPFIYINDDFYQDRLRTNILGKTQRRTTRFCRDLY